MLAFDNGRVDNIVNDELSPLREHMRQIDALFRLRVLNFVRDNSRGWQLAALNAFSFFEFTKY